MKNFSELNLPAELNEALASMGFETPTPIQAQAIPVALEGKDILACAQTGTGKTAAFAIPMIAKLLQGEKKQTLILAPTRELAEQIVESLRQLTNKSPNLRLATVIGGKNYFQQEKQLKSNPMFVVATPGRLIDHVNRKTFSLKNFTALILDEADRMLDMGFGPQLDKIVACLPKERQTLLFSATLAPEIRRIALKYMKEPVSISVSADTVSPEKIRHSVVKTSIDAKPDVLMSEIDKLSGTMIIFARTKSRTDKVARILNKAGHKVTLIHGDRSQNQRSRAIEGFKDGTYRILVATDIAARGLDIRHIEHVINYDLPMASEDYIHRIGRTARAGADGHAMALVTPQDTRQWNQISKLIHGKNAPQETGAHGGENRERFNPGDRDEARKNRFTPKRDNVDSWGRRDAGGRQERWSDTKSRLSPRRDGKGSGGFRKDAPKEDSFKSYEKYQDEDRSFGTAKPGNFSRPPFKKNFNNRPPQKSFNRDDSRPQRSFGDRPSYSDRPARSDRPERSFGRDDNRSFKKNSYGDKPFKKSFSKEPKRKQFDSSSRSEGAAPAKKEGFFQKTFGRKPKVKKDLQKYFD